MVIEGTWHDNLPFGAVLCRTSSANLNTAQTCTQENPLFEANSRLS